MRNFLLIPFNKIFAELTNKDLLLECRDDMHFYLKNNKDNTNIGGLQHYILYSCDVTTLGAVRSDMLYGTIVVPSTIEPVVHIVTINSTIVKYEQISLNNNSQNLSCPTKNDHQLTTNISSSFKEIFKSVCVRHDGLCLNEYNPSLSKNIEKIFKYIQNILCSPTNNTINTINSIQTTNSTISLIGNDASNSIEKITLHTMHDTDNNSTSSNTIITAALGASAMATTIVPVVVGISENVTLAITSTVIPVIGITANTTEVVGATTVIAEVVSNATTTGVVSTIFSIPLWGVIGGILTATGIIGGGGYLGYRIYSACKEKQYYASVNQNETVNNNMELQTMVVNTEVNLPKLDNLQHTESAEQKIPDRFSKFELCNLKDMQEKYSSIQIQPTCSNQKQSIRIDTNGQDVNSNLVKSSLAVPYNKTVQDSALCEKLLHVMPAAIGESGHSQVHNADNNTVYKHSNGDIKDMSGNLDKSALPSSHNDIMSAHQLCQELAHNMSVIGESDSLSN